MLGDGVLRLSRRIPGLYSTIAFLAARRIVVRGPSMYPALRPGDRVLFDRLAYRLDDPQPGDIALACHPSRPGVRFIKRVAAGHNTTRRDAPQARLGGWGGGGDAPGPDGYWLLGDNPDASTDSRALGPFRREDLLARAWWVYWPRERVRRIERP